MILKDSIGSSTNYNTCRFHFATLDKHLFLVVRELWMHVATVEVERGLPQQMFVAKMTR